jgi:hypothetical protein
VTEVMKEVAVEWKSLSDEDKKHWEEAARLDKERFVTELKDYKGPLKVPARR